jgi:hypothetical protein
MFPSGKETALLALLIAVAGYSIITGLVKIGEWVSSHVVWAP